MTPEERQQAFTAAYNLLVQQYGIVLEAQLQAEQLGTAVLTKPVMMIALVNGWQPASAPKVGAPLQTDEVQDVIAPIPASVNGHKETV